MYECIIYLLLFYKKYLNCVKINKKFIYILFFFLGNEYIYEKTMWKNGTKKRYMGIFFLVIFPHIRIK